MKTLLIAFIFASFGIQAAPLDDLRATGATIVMKKLAPAQIQDLRNAEDRYILDVQLHIKDQSQFNKAKSLLHPGNSARFSGAKTYSIEEFLPPLAKVLVNKVFITKSWDTEPLRPYLENPGYADDPIIWGLLKNGLSSFSNCWNTTTQIARSVHSGWDNKVQLYWPGRDEVTSNLRDKDYTSKIALKDVKPGDAIIFSMKNSVNGENEIQHTAILISQDILFEKTDGSDSDPWRLSLKDDVIKKYKRLLSTDYIVEYRRFNGKKVYPDAEISESDPSDVKLFKKVFPDIEAKYMHFGCETGLGGGCDATITVIENATLQTSADGKSSLVGSQAFLKRLINLK